MLVQLENAPTDAYIFYKSNNINYDKFWINRLLAHHMIYFIEKMAPVNSSTSIIMSAAIIIYR